MLAAKVRDRAIEQASSVARGVVASIADKDTRGARSVFVNRGPVLRHQVLLYRGWDLLVVAEFYAV